MSYDAYKREEVNRAYKTLYTREELEQMDLSVLKEICKRENIKTPTIGMLSNKEELREYIYKHRGTKVLKQTYIKKLEESAVLRLQDAINKGNKEKRDLINLKTTELRIYKGIDSLTGEDDKCFIESSIDLPESNVILVENQRTNEKVKVVGILKLKRAIDKNEYQLILNRDMILNTVNSFRYKNFSLIFFPKESVNDVVKIYSKIDNNGDSNKIVLNYIKVDIPMTIVEEIPETEEILMIDFGNAYTTAGTYNQNAKRSESIVFESTNIETQDVHSEKERADSKKLYPSVVSVKRCKNDTVKFYYGNEALEKLRANGYIQKNTVIYGIKHLITSHEENIEVSDSNGNISIVKKSYIVKTYLNHVIKLSEQQNKVKYKNIYISSPIKQKELYQKIYREMCKENRYNLANNPIDETTAIMYKSIDQSDYERFEPTSVLIINVGSRSSDIIRYDYTIELMAVTNASKIEADVNYIYGDTSFGGDSITYRILQYIKVKLASYVNKENLKSNLQIYKTNKYMQSADSEYTDKDIFIENLVKDILIEKHDKSYDLRRNMEYSNLINQYKQANEIIPTNFTDYKKKNEDEYLKVKANYYLLWNIAESIKKHLYETRTTFAYDISKEFMETNIDSNIFYKKCNLHVRNKNNELETWIENPQIIILKEEINHLIKPEISQFIKGAMKTIDEYTLAEITRINLTGLSCNIDLFREIIKEYIEGRKVKSETETSYDKKLMLVNGMTEYEESKKIGRIKPTINYSDMASPYELTAQIFNESMDEEITLIRKGELLSEIYSYISRDIETVKIEFNLININTNTQNEIIYWIDSKKHKQIHFETIKETYKVIKQEDIDTIKSNEVKLFIFTHEQEREKNWGFNILEVSRQEEKIYCGGLKYIPFEPSQWEIDYFDGLK